MSVATHDGHVYVLDSSKRQIIRFDPDGQNAVTVLEADDETGVLTEPQVVAIDVTGRIFVSNYAYTEDDSYLLIQVFDAAGVLLATLSAPDPISIGSEHGIAFASDGRVFVNGVHSTEFMFMLFEWAPNFSLVGTHVLWDGSENIGSIAIDGDDRLYVVGFGSPPVLQVFSLADFSVIATCDYSGADPSGFLSISGVAADADDNVFVVDSGELNRVIKLAWADENTLSYVGEVGAFGDGPEQFANPSGIAVDEDGKVYVADTSNARIQRLSNALNFQMRWGAPTAGQFQSPTALAADSDSAVYVVDERDNRVHKLDGNSAPVKWGGSGAAVGRFNNPTGIAIDSANTLYVADQYNSRVQLFGANGDSAGTPWELGVEVANIAIGPADTFYVTDTSTYGVLKLDDAGSQLADFGDWLIYYPLGIAVGSDGTVYVADGDADKVKRFESDGTPLPDWELPGANGVAIDAAGRVFVSSYTDDRIHVLDTTGAELFAFGESGEEDGEFDGPGALAFDAAGNLLIADGSGRVQRFTPTAGRAARRNASRGDGKQANGKRKHRKRKGGHNRDKRRNHRHDGPRGRSDGRGKGGSGRERSAAHSQKGRDTRN